jgi:hypothetical protein
VDDSGGGPIAHALVFARSENSELAASRTDVRGVYDVRPLPGRYMLVADADGYASQGPRWSIVRARR